MLGDTFTQKVNVPVKNPKRGLLRFVRKLAQDNIEFQCDTIPEIITLQLKVTKVCNQLAAMNTDLQELKDVCA